MFGIDLRNRTHWFHYSGLHSGRFHTSIQCVWSVFSPPHPPLLTLFTALAPLVSSLCCPGRLHFYLQISVHLWFYVSVLDVRSANKRKHIFVSLWLSSLNLIISSRIHLQANHITSRFIAEKLSAQFPLRNCSGGRTLSLKQRGQGHQTWHEFEG